MIVYLAGKFQSSKCEPRCNFARNCITWKIIKLLCIYSLQVKLNAEHIVGSRLSLIKYASQCYNCTSLQNTSMVMSAKDFSSYGGEEWRNQLCAVYRESGFKIIPAQVEGQPYSADFCALCFSLNPHELDFLSVPLSLLILLTWGKTILIVLCQLFWH